MSLRGGKKRDKKRDFCHNRTRRIVRAERTHTNDCITESRPCPIGEAGSDDPRDFYDNSEYIGARNPFCATNLPTEWSTFCASFGVWVARESRCWVYVFTRNARNSGMRRKRTSHRPTDDASSSRFPAVVTSCLYLRVYRSRTGGDRIAQSFQWSVSARWNDHWLTKRTGTIVSGMWWKYE